MSYGIHGKTMPGISRSSNGASIRTARMTGDYGASRGAMGFHRGGVGHRRFMASLDRLQSRQIAKIEQNALKSRAQMSKELKVGRIEDSRRAYAAAMSRIRAEDVAKRRTERRVQRDWWVMAGDASKAKVGARSQSRRTQVQAQTTHRVVRAYHMAPHGELNKPSINTYR